MGLGFRDDDKSESERAFRVETSWWKARTLQEQKKNATLLCKHSTQEEACTCLPSLNLFTFWLSLSVGRWGEFDGALNREDSARNRIGFGVQASQAPDGH